MFGTFHSSQSQRFYTCMYIFVYLYLYIFVYVQVHTYTYLWWLLLEFKYRSIYLYVYCISVAWLLWRSCNRILSAADYWRCLSDTHTHPQRWCCPVVWADSRSLVVQGRQSETQAVVRCELVSIRNCYWNHCSQTAFLFNSKHGWCSSCD